MLSNPLSFRMSLVAQLLFSALISLPCQAQIEAGSSSALAIVWSKAVSDGQVEITNGEISNFKIVGGEGQITGRDRFAATRGPLRVEFTAKGVATAYSKGRPLVTVRTREEGFSFFVRDVDSRYPIYLPSYQVIVTAAEDKRSYGEIEKTIRSRGLQTTLQRIEAELEETFENAALHTKSLQNQTWLGLSRDIRIFAISERLDWIQPRFAGWQTIEGEMSEKPSPYSFSMGRGWGPVEKIERRLEDGVLPILRGALVDDDVHYELTAFVGLETRPLLPANLRGTHFLVADR